MSEEQGKPEASRPPAGSEPPPYPSPRYSWYVLLVLMLVYVNSFMDRQILNLLVAPIRRDLDISDKQMSYLMGLSFAVFYTFCGIPLGRLADSWNRKWLIVIGQAFWSVCSAGCGLAKSFVSFLLFRMGVGVGEATLSPSAYSLITDMFPRERLATAISVYSMGIYLGGGLASLLGGTIIRMVADEPTWTVPIVGEVFSWQVVFFLVAAPVVPLTLLLLTVREPARRASAGRSATASIPLGEVVRYIRANWATFLCHNVGFACLSLSAYGNSAWIPTYLVRIHGESAGNAGQMIGIITMTCGTAGIVTGGMMSDWLRSRGHADARIKMGLAAAILWIPTGVIFPLAPSGTLAYWLLAPTIFFTSMPFGVAPTAIQEVVPPTMRGQASAIYLFVVNLIGLGIGPTLVALFTEDIFGRDDAVHYSILAVGIIAHVIAALALWGGIKPYRRSLAALEAGTADAR